MSENPIILTYGSVCTNVHTYMCVTAWFWTADKRALESRALGSKSASDSDELCDPGQVTKTAWGFSQVLVV